MSASAEGKNVSKMRKYQIISTQRVLVHLLGADCPEAKLTAVREPIFNGILFK